jgi:hypothetical protein
MKVVRGLNSRASFASLTILCLGDLETADIKVQAMIKLRVCCIAALWLLTTGAYAEQPSDLAAATVVDKAPDIVRLKNGGMVRGTISEVVPNESVVIVTLTGESRTFAMKDVAYAGPRKDGARPVAVEAPAKPPAVQTAQAQPQAEDEAAQVRFESIGPERELTLHVRAAMSQGIVFNAWTMGIATVDSETYRQVCSAPCEVKMRPDRYKFALSDKSGHTIVVDNPVAVNGSTTLYGRLDSMQGVRTAGWIVVAVSVLGGLAIATLAPAKSSQQYEVSPLTIGLVVGVVGSTVGILLGMVSDEAHVTAQ